MQQTLRRRLLLVVALGAWLTLPAAAGRRTLAQAGNGPAAAADGMDSSAVAVSGAPAPTSEPSIYGAPDVDACVQLTNSAGQACTVESDTSESVANLLGRKGGHRCASHVACQLSRHNFSPSKRLNGRGPESAACICLPDLNIAVTDQSARLHMCMQCPLCMRADQSSCPRQRRPPPPLPT
jgi:hypothetical protein